MTDPTAKAPNPVLQKAADFLIGFGLIIKGCDKLEHFDRSPLLVGFLFLAAAAATFVLNAIFVPIIWMNTTAAALAVGGIIILLTGKGAAGQRDSKR